MQKNRPRHVTVLLLLYHREQKDCHGHERKVLWKTFVILRDWTTTSAVAFWRLHQKRKKRWNILYNCTRGRKLCWHHYNRYHSLAETWRDFHKSRESKSMNKCLSVCVFVFHCNKPIKSNFSVSTSCQIIKHTQLRGQILFWFDLWYSKYCEILGVPLWGPWIFTADHKTFNHYLFIGRAERLTRRCQETKKVSGSARSFKIISPEINE